MTRLNGSSLLALLAWAALLGGCSLQTPPQVPCEDTLQCRGAFGQGSVCGRDGLCAVVDPGPRCASLYPAEIALPVDPDEVLLVASLFNYNNQTHIARAQSARLAISQVNDVGGLSGRSVAILECNNAEDAALDALTQDEATTALATLLAEDIGIPAIIGPSSSDRTSLAFEAASPAGTLVFSPSATSPALTALDGLYSTDEAPGLLWRTAAPDDLQGEVIAQDMIDRGRLAAAVIYRTGAYGEGLADAFQAAFSGRVSRFPFSNEEARDLATVDAGATNIGEILFISSEVEDIVAFLDGAATLETYEGLGIFLTDAAANPDVLSQAAGAAGLFPQVRLTKPVAPEGVVYDSFAAGYRAAYGGEDVGDYSYTAHSFDAAWLTLYGAAWSLAQEGAVTGLGIARGLRRVSEGDPLELRPSSWSTAKATFALGAGVDVIGASGSLDYDPETGETRALIGVLVIDPDGEGFSPAP